jgi:hypothetical protein
VVKVLERRYVKMRERERERERDGWRERGGINME